MNFDLLSALARQGSKVPLFAKGRANPYSILFRSTHRLNIDDAGRITLPDSFIERAGLTKTAVFTGEGYSFQIWSPEAQAQQATDDMASLEASGDLETLETDFAAAAAVVMDL